MSQFIIYFLVFSILSISCNCFNPKAFNASKTQSDLAWSSAGATWYGEANGAGSNGGACGYTNSVEESPFSSLVSAGGPSLFKSGNGCGACYEVKCMVSDNTVCSGNPVTVVITDECPAKGVCSSDSTHFDLSGTAFGAMAISGKANQLRNAGQLKIQYKRVDCNYKGVQLTFHIDSGSSAYYFATLIEYEGGKGDLSAVQLKQASGGSWISMDHSWGAVWKLNYASGAGLKPPFSLKLTDDSGKTLIANNVIPTGWKAGEAYKSSISSFA